MRSFLLIVSCFLPPAAVVSCAFTACAADIVQAEQGHGTGRFEKAIHIFHTGDYDKSIDQEYEYLSARLGVRNRDWRLVTQRLLSVNGRDYDEIIVECKGSREPVTFYFDITEPLREMRGQLQLP